MTAPSDPSGIVAGSPDTPQPASDTPRKPGRPREHADRTTTAIRFAPELHAELERAAIERDVSMNFLVNKAVAEFVKRLIPVDEMVWTREPHAHGITNQPGTSAEATT